MAHRRHLLKLWGDLCCQGRAWQWKWCRSTHFRPCKPPISFFYQEKKRTCDSLMFLLNGGVCWSENAWTAFDVFVKVNLPKGFWFGLVAKTERLVSARAPACSQGIYPHFIRMVLARVYSAPPRISVANMIASTRFTPILRAPGTGLGKRDQPIFTCTQCQYTNSSEEVFHYLLHQCWKNFLCATRHKGTTPKKSVAKLEPGLKTWSPKQNTKANSCKTVQKNNARIAGTLNKKMQDIMYILYKYSICRKARKQVHERLTKGRKTRRSPWFYLNYLRCHCLLHPETPHTDRVMA